MGVLDFLKRKKKDDDFLDLGAPGTVGGAYGPAGYPQGLGSDAGMGQQAGGGPMGGFEQFPGTAQAGGMMAGNDVANLRNTVDAMNYKLDALKAALDAINARLANIESALKAVPTEKGEGWM